MKRLAIAILFLVVLIASCAPSSNVVTDVVDKTRDISQNTSEELKDTEYISKENQNEIYAEDTETLSYVDNKQIDIKQQIIDICLPKEAELLSVNENAIFYLVTKDGNGQVVTQYYKYDKKTDDNILLYETVGNYGPIFSDVYNDKLLVASWEEKTRILAIDTSVDSIYEFNSTYFPNIIRCCDHLLITDYVKNGLGFTQKLLSIDLNNGNIEVIDEQEYSQSEDGTYISGTRINHFNGLDDTAIIEYVSYDKQQIEDGDNIYWKKISFEEKELKKLPLDLGRTTSMIMGTENIILFNYFPDRIDEVEEVHLLVKESEKNKEYLIPKTFYFGIETAEILMDRYVYLQLADRSMYVLDTKDLCVDKFADGELINGKLIKIGDNSLAGIAGGKLMTYTINH